MFTTTNAMLVILAFAAFISWSECAPVEDEIRSLPSVNFVVKFKQYAGYLNTSDDSRKFFYWCEFFATPWRDRTCTYDGTFTESQQSPSKDPLLVWFNGGPGCSSLRGLLSEIGPFEATDGGAVLREKVHTWTKIANVLFIDTPGSTGFSYFTRPYSENDEQTATDNYHALLDFTTRKFPEYKQNPLYITGFSYAGRYIPMLAIRVLNDEYNFTNFRGISIGNGLLSQAAIFNSRIYYLYYHGMVSDRDWSQLTTNCCNVQCGVRCDFLTVMMQNRSQQCTMLIGQIARLAENSGFDQWDFLATCYMDAISGEKQCEAKDPLEEYLNRRDVQKAIHVSERLYDKRFESCRTLTDYTSGADSMDVPIKRLISAGIRVLLYNGDTDIAVNFLATQWFAEDLNRTIVRDKHVWTYESAKPNGAGYAVLYDGVHFLTVKGSGHYATHDKRRETLQMISTFISNSSNYSAPVQNVDFRPSPLLSRARRTSERSSMAFVLACAFLIQTPMTVVLARFVGSTL